MDLRSVYHFAMDGLVAKKREIERQMTEIATLLEKEIEVAEKENPPDRPLGEAKPYEIPKVVLVKDGIAPDLAGDSTPKKKRVMSAQGKANLRKALKKRWREFHRAKKAGEI